MVKRREMRGAQWSPRDPPLLPRLEDFEAVDARESALDRRRRCRSGGEEEAPLAIEAGVFDGAGDAPSGIAGGARLERFCGLDQPAVCSVVQVPTARRDAGERREDGVDVGHLLGRGGSG